MEFIIAALIATFWVWIPALLVAPFMVWAYVEGWLKFRKGLVYDAQNREYVTVAEAEYRHALWLLERGE